MRNHSKTLSVFGASVFALTAAVPAATASTTYDAVAGFAGATNPNGVWSYYRNGTLFTNSQGSATSCCTIGLPGYWSGQPLPDSMIILQNPTGSTFNWANGIFPPANSLWLDPESGSLEVVFTAPSAGTYTIAGDFLGIDINQNSHPVRVLKNSTAAWSGTISSFGQDAPFSFPVVLNTGDTISFYVGTGSTGCSFCALSTSLKATITLSGPPQPVSHVTPFSATASSANFTVQWSGTAPAGIRDYTIYVSDNGGAFVPWLTATTATQAVYSGAVGHSYGFYSIATDNAGALESAKSAAEAMTTVASNGPIYDVVAGFAGATNPNGVWSYYRNGTLFANSQGSTTNCCSIGLPGWWSGLPLPDSMIILQNATGSTFNWANGIFPPAHSLWLDPESGNLAVVFTASSAGAYTIAGDFLGIDINENSHPVRVLKNGIAAWSGTISSFGQDAPFSFPVVLNTGDTISFYVGTGSLGCSFCSLSTALKATIIFGLAPPQPVSHVTALPATAPSANFTVQWSGTAPGIGIRDFTIYVSDNGGAFTPWLTATTATQAVYAGATGHTYGFYSIARDNAGSQEVVKTAAEATTTVTATGPVYDIVAGFAGATNPNGVWSYYRNGTLFANSQGSATSCCSTGLPGYFNGLPVPNNLLLVQNVTGSTLNWFNVIFPPTNSLWLDPEIGNLAVVFTAPSAGTYNIVGDFLGIDTRQNSHPVQVLKNGAVAWSGTISSYGQDDSFNFPVVLNAGDTLSFYVGTGSTGCSYCFLSTGLKATITLGGVSGPPQPVSHVTTLPATFASPDITLHWSAAPGFTVASFTIYVSDNGGPFTPWRTATQTTEGVFHGAAGHTYGFYSIVTDTTGSRENPKTSADTVTRILPKPVSHVLELPFTAAALTLPVRWSPIAADAVIRSYTIYVSDNGAPFTVWVASTTATQATWSGLCGHTYGFYSIATDNSGVQETPKSVADAVTRTPSNPVSRVTTLPPTVTSPNFNVQWSGSDTCSTIQAFDIYVSDNGGPFVLWLSRTAAASAYYSGVLGHRYGFYSIAIVATGSREPAKTTADATTQTPSQSVGDITGDGRVDCADATIVRGSIGKIPGQQFYNPRADINGDGFVDASDLAIVVQLQPPGTRCP